MLLSRVVAGVVVTWLLGAGCLAAELTISPVFSSGMVLQRDAPIVLTGRAAAGTTVEVGLGQHTRSVEADRAGVWRAEFEPLPAGGPHVVIVRDGEQQARLNDVLVGDVWVFSGQSNMQMGLDEIDGGAEALTAITDDAPIRLLVVPKAGADSPQSEFPAKWRHASRDAAARFSAVGWCFATHLREDEQLAQIPLGLIDASYGGTAIEAWLPTEAVAAIPQEQRTESGFKVSSSGLYNQMIAPLMNYRVKGVAWYQGESNAGNPEPYAGLLETLMAQWRAGWAAPRLPFYVVQLPAFDGRIGDLDFSWLREAEARACQNTDDAWFAVTYDTTPGFDLHPREKNEVGRRLALLALSTQYGRDLMAESPVFQGVEWDDAHLSVVFDQPVLPKGEKALRGFEVAGADGEFRYVQATAKGNRAVLDVEKVGEPLDTGLGRGGDRAPRQNAPLRKHHGTNGRYGSRILGTK